MYKVNLIESASYAFKNAEESLYNIVQGDEIFSNYRKYILNLHSSFELFFKNKLLERDIMLIFSAKQYEDVMKIAKKAKLSNITFLEYLDTPNCKLPHTVSFMDAIKRLAYLCNDGLFDEGFIKQLDELNNTRNSITHFEFNLDNEKFYVLNELFIKCVDIYSEYNEWGYKSIVDLDTLKSQNRSIIDLIVGEPFNSAILKSFIDGESFVNDSFHEYENIADCLIEDLGNDFTHDDKCKIISRLETFYKLGFFIQGSVIGENWDVEWFSLSEKAKSILLQTALMD